MAGFIRVRNCCCCGGSLKGASIAIGVIYLVFNIVGISVGRNLILAYGGVLSSTGTLELYGTCVEGLFFPMLEVSSIISAVANVSLLYGSVTSKSAFLGLWLAWNIAYPFIQLSHIIWSIVNLATCDMIQDMRTTVIAILSINAVILGSLFYFGVVVYSLYKDLEEEEKKNNSYGARVLLPSRNWDEALTPYTSYDPSVATPTAWGGLPPPPSNKGPAPPPPPMQRQKTGIPRPQSTSTFSA